MKLKKRGAIYSVIALMLCVAVYLNWSYTKDEITDQGTGIGSVDKTIGEKVEVGSTESDKINTDLVSVSQASDYFSEARLSRQKARDEAVNILTGTIDSMNATEDAKAVANTNIQLLAGNAMSEARIENLVIAKGYKDCVVFVNEDVVNVIIAKTENGLTDADVAKIKDIVIDEAAVNAMQIKVFEAQ